MQRLPLWLAVTLCVAPALAQAQQATQDRTRFLAPEYFEAQARAGQSPDDALRDTLNEALARFQDQQYQESLELLTAAAIRYPGLPPARVMLARTFLATNRSRQAKSMLEQAAVQNPDYPGVYLLLGNLALVEGDLTDGLLEFQAAAGRTDADAVPEDQRRFFAIQAHAGIATVAEARNEWSLAREQLEAWLELDPENAKARQRLGRALFGLGEAEQAHEELSRSEQQDPAIEPAAVAMGWLHHRNGDAEQANEWMQKAQQQQPDNPKVHVALGSWLLEVGRIDEARQHAARVEELAPQSAELKMLRGAIAHRQGDYAEAEQQFDALLKQNPGNLAASNNLALALAEQNDPDKRSRALDLAQANARQQPNSPEILSTLGWVLYRMGRLDEAERILQASVAGGRASADTAYYLAHVFRDRGRLPQVRKLLQAALGTKGPFSYREEAEQWLQELGPEQN
jgi:tetratricopeptide (TPR) repeat protein